MLPITNRMATAVNTNGHIFVGTFEVFAPVSAVHIAITSSIPAEILNTTRETSLVVPPRIFVKITSTPIKQRVNPSATHSIKMNFLLSSEMSLNPFTTTLAANMWAIPHPMVIIAPAYNNIFATISLPIYFCLIFRFFRIFCNI